MSWARIVVTPPEGEPLSLEAAKAHCRADGGDDDALIASCIAAARAHVESVTGQVLRAQTLRLLATSWDDLEALPLAPVNEVTSIVYSDVQGDEATLAAEIYTARLEGLSPSIVLNHGAVWPSTMPDGLIRVTVEAGYKGEADIPPELMAAMKLLVGDLFANRETTGAVTGQIAMSATVENLLVNQRRWL